MVMIMAITIIIIIIIIIIIAKSNFVVKWVIVFLVLRGFRVRGSVLELSVSSDS